MHHDQVDVGVEQVVALIAEQLPALAGLDVVALRGTGTVNAIFRIGDHVTARFPLRPDDPRRVTARLRSEMAAATEFREASPAPAPEPLYVGAPGHGYPLPWSAQTWLDGATATPSSCEHSAALAGDLTSLLRGLRDWDTRGRRFRGDGRGGRLADHDDWINECIRHSEGLVDTPSMRAMWATFRSLPREDPDVMCHGDLIPSNLLVDAGRLVGVLDTGGFGPADPALDLVSAWHLLSDAPREQLRRDLRCSDLQWERGRAWAFQQAAGAYWYYQHSNPAMVEMGRTTLRRLIG